MKHAVLTFFLIGMHMLGKSQTLLTDPAAQFAITEAITEMYNFKFERAEPQFLQFKKEHPKHPLPYFLFGLAQFWQYLANDEKTDFDEPFLNYMDTVIELAEKRYDQNEKDFEAIFFLAAAHGFKGRLYSDRSQWTKATLSGRSALKYLQKSREFNDLSPEFLFGEGLYNYYEEWIRENYPGLRPVLWFFPNGDKVKGLQQLKATSENAFYARTEAQVFLMRILAAEEGKHAESLPIAELLNKNFPDNPFMERFYARCLFQTGKMNQCIQVAKSIERKIDQKFKGYDEASGRYASFFLGWYAKAGNPAETKIQFEKTVRYSEQLNATQMGYYFYALAGLAKIAADAGDIHLAKQYYEKVLSVASKYHPTYAEAKAYLKTLKK